MKKFLLLIVLSLSSSVFATDINIFWWNIGFNDYANQANDSQTDLDITLKTKDFSKYDVIALGEYKENTLEKSSLDNIKKAFPHQRIVRYNTAYNKAISIYSKYAFELKEGSVDWVNPYWSDKEKARYKKDAPFFYGSTNTFKRKYIRIRFYKENKEINLIPYHINNPWSGMKEKFGKYLTASEIIWGQDNPLINQVKQMHMKIKMDLGANYRDKNIIMLGDSNCPDKVKGLSTACFNRLADILPTRTDSEGYITYPARHSTMEGKSPKVKIDHVQASDSFYNTQTKIRGLKGSDHYPLSFKGSL